MKRGRPKKQTTKSSPEFCAMLYFSLLRAQRAVDKYEKRLNEEVAKLTDEQVAKYLNNTTCP